MIMRLLLAGFLAWAVMATPGMATAQVSPDAEPLQFYVFSFTDAPAAEAAEDVVAGALAYDLEIDPAIDALVTFRADGWYSGEALLRDFGTALLDQDIALVRTGEGAYALVPRVNAPMLMARGGVVMQLEEPQTARSPTDRKNEQQANSVQADSRWWEGVVAGMALFFAGAAAGAAALLSGQILWRRAEAERRRLSSPLLRLTDQRLRLQPPDAAMTGDPELIIPTFKEDA